MNRKQKSLPGMLQLLFGLAASILLLSALAANVHLSQAAPTATYFVNAATGSDSNDCLSQGTACATIGAAVAKTGDGDAIEITAGTYYESDMTINTAITINGAGAGSTIVDGGGNGRIFTLNSHATLSNMTLQNGQTPADSSIFVSGGGAVLVGNGMNVLLQNVTLTNNISAGSGGAIFTLGNLTIDNSDIISNTANSLGGGIYNYTFGTLTVSNSHIQDNTALGSQAGGLYTSRPLTVTNSTISGNSATSFGGGVIVGTETAVFENTTFTNNQSASGPALFAQSGTITMTNSTVSGNVATNNNSGIYVSGPSVSLTLINNTIANNTRTGTAGTGWNGISAANNATVTLQNNIIANNQEQQCQPGSNTTWVSNGNNLSSDFNCNLTGTGDMQGVDPLLGLLADNSGPTQTHALQPGSPAIDAGSNTNCPAADQRGIARPYDGNNDGTATCDMGAYEAQHQLTIADSSILEGTGGSVTAVFTVTLTPDSSQIVTVDFATADGTATASTDYTSTSGTLTFNPGDTEQTINVPITTDSNDENDEIFGVLLFNPNNASILDETAVGTIIDDDGLSTLTINDVTISEGTGTNNAVFDVTLSPAAANTVTVDYITADGTAVAGSDYTTTSGTLTFSTGETSKQITVPILHDTYDEGGDETFTVQLSNQTNANLADATGQATITDNDTATLSQNVGPSVMEGDSGTTPAVFTVSLSTPAAFVVTVDYAISDGYGDTGAKFGSDYTGTVTGTLTFQPGDTEKTYSVDVIGDLDAEGDEIFSSLISNANAPISVNGSIGHILNDDNYRVMLPVIVR
ncbi:MAG: hypothetical protein Kow0080_19190 [Candidatus Promineifilaceae bacterium]